MKISEAEKLICPFIRAVDRGGWNRHNGCPSHINCITDKCMAWETTSTYVTIGYSREIDEDGNQVPYIEDLPREDCEGYCSRLKW
jgi:hypothetical protein